MAILSRKDREIRDREVLLLDVARGLLLERGYLGLTMDRIAEATEYSKGTIYQHFANKEDLMVALMVRAGELRYELFERAATFAGAPRARMTAVGVAVELFYRLFPDFSLCEQAMKTQSIRAKASPERIAALESCEFRSLNVCFGLTRDAVAQGDLVLPEGERLEDLTLGLWSLYQGGFSLMGTELPFDRLGFGDPLEALRRNAQVFLDGCVWRPLSSETDYGAVRDRIFTEVFADECRRLQE